MRHLIVYCELDMEASVSTLRTVYTVLAHLCHSLTGFTVLQAFGDIFSVQLGVLVRVSLL